MEEYDTLAIQIIQLLEEKLCHLFFKHKMYKKLKAIQSQEKILKNVDNDSEFSRTAFIWYSKYSCNHNRHEIIYIKTASNNPFDGCL